jgi:hypothetical protein
MTLSSFGHKFAGVALDDPNFTTPPYDKWAAYGQSKTANSLFSVELERRGTERGIGAFAVHPGRTVSTDLLCRMTDEEMKDFGVYRKNGIIKVVAAYGIGVKSIEQGAATSVWCAVSSQLSGKGGVYYADCDIAELVSDDSQLQSGVRRWAIDKPTAKASE